MAVFKCNISGNTVEVNSPLDIKSMEVHSGYTLVEGYTLVKKYVSPKQEEDLRSPVPQPIEEGGFEDIVVKKKSKKKNKEL